MILKRVIFGAMCALGRGSTGWGSENGTTCDFRSFRNPRDELVIIQSNQRCRFRTGREERKNPLEIHDHLQGMESTKVYELNFGTEVAACALCLLYPCRLLSFTLTEVPQKIMVVIIPQKNAGSSYK